ncbi:MAG: hypothetical protein JOZ62_09655 [Acidobacteriaceae bacterium]|nr:hypothetical protein [Acidobacteriaceae bacterium]
MQSSPDAANGARRRLQDLREAVLALHKALLDSERTSYEIVHGPIPSPGAFLQLLIKDPRFAWLQPMTTLIVQIDEALAAKRPAATERDFEQLIEDTRALLSPSREVSAFWKRYSNAVHRDPGVEVLHIEVEKQLANR